MCISLLWVILDENRLQPCISNKFVIYGRSCLHVIEVLLFETVETVPLNGLY